MKILKDESGNILVLSALCLTMLLSVSALAIDVGLLFDKQSHLQTLADTAAMAGALEASACGTTANCGVVQTAATSALTEGGNSAPTLFLQCAAASGTGILLTVNNGPCALGASDPNNLNANYVEAVVTEQEPTLYAGFFGIRSVRITARAEAGKAVASAPCLNITGTTGQTLTLNSGASIQDGAGSSCGVNVNSNGTPAVMEDGGATVNVGSYTVHGTVTDNGGSYTPTPTTGAPTMPDPFQAEITAGTLSVPTQPAASSTCCNPVGGNHNVAAWLLLERPQFQRERLYRNSQPRIYYFGGGVNVGGVTINGTGVTIYMASGQFNMNSASTINLTAPSTGATAGLVIWQPSSNTSQMNLDSGSNSSWKGGVYLPGAQLTLNGGSTAAGYGMIVAKSVMMNSAITLSCSFMPGGVCPGGGSGAGNGSATIALAE